jgi:sugar phosphate isomerase/epimerase
MLLGYNTNGLAHHRLDDALRLLAEEGYRAVALTLDVHHLDPFVATPAEVARLARTLQQLDLRPVIETGARYLLDPRRKHEPTLMCGESDGVGRRLDFYRRAAAIGRDLGARVLSFWSGIDRRPGADSRARLADGVARTTAIAREAGLTAALEPEPGMAVATMADFARLAADLGAQAPALTLDVGHLYVTEAEPPADLIARFAPQLAQVHLEDIRRGVHEHLPPGEGDVDFPLVLDTLARSGFREAVCFELSRSSHQAPDAIRLCRRVWDRRSVARSDAL